MLTHPVTDLVETVSHASHSLCIRVGLKANEYNSLATTYQHGQVSQINSTQLNIQ